MLFSGVSPFFPNLVLSSMTNDDHDDEDHRFNMRENYHILYCIDNVHIVTYLVNIWNEIFNYSHLKQYVNLYAAFTYA